MFCRLWSLQCNGIWPVETSFLQNRMSSRSLLQKGHHKTSTAALINILIYMLKGPYQTGTADLNPFPSPARAQAALTCPPPPPPPEGWIPADSIRPAASSATRQRCGRKRSAPPSPSPPRPLPPRKLKPPQPPPLQATVAPGRRRAAKGSERSGTPRLSPTGK